MKFKIEKLTQYDIIKKGGLGTLKENPKANFSNIKIVKMLDDNYCELGFAIITPKDNFNFDEVFKYNFGGLLEYSKIEFNDLYNQFKQTLQECSYLNYIEIYNKNKGYGKIFLDYLKEHYKHLWLYSVIESEHFWESNNFIEISPDDHNYYI